MTNLEQILKQMRDKGWTPRITPRERHPADLAERIKAEFTADELDDFVRLVGEERRRDAERGLPSR